jgi:hypothetical protein
MQQQHGLVLASRDEVKPYSVLSPANAKATWPGSSQTPDSLLMTNSPAHSFC